MKKIILLIGLLVFILSSCAKTYTVTFFSNGGNYVQSIRLTEESSVPLPNIYRSGYILEGWYTSFNNGETFDEKWNFSTFKISSDVTLYAKWTLVNLEDALIHVTFLVDEVSYTVSGLYNDPFVLPNVILNYNSLYFNALYIQGWDQDIPAVFPNEDLVISASMYTKSYTLEITDLSSIKTTFFMNSKDEIQDYVNSSQITYYMDEAMSDLFDINHISTSIIELYFRNMIYITYADWGDPELNQKLIEAFMEKYPYINVSLRSDIQGSGATFIGNLITAAQADSLPDVFVTDNVPTVISAGLTLDVSQYWNDDPDTKLVYEGVAATGLYGDKRLALPSYQFLKGIMINLDAFDKANLSTTANYRVDNDGYPVKDWTFEEFLAIAAAIKDFNPDNYSSGYMLGLDTWFGTPDFQQVWPMMDDATVGYDTWDGTRFNFSSSTSWKNAMTKKIALHALTDGTTTRFTQEFLDLNQSLAIYHIQNGTVAMDIEGSWQFWVLNAAKKKGINLGFWPYPQGSAGFFPPTILNYLAVSSATDYPEEAYLLAKWMSFGRDGYSARLDVLDSRNAFAAASGNSSLLLDRFPVADYPDVWVRVKDMVAEIEGIEYILNNIDKARPDLDKWLPGYKDFWAWVYDPKNPYNFDNLVTQGADAVPTFAAEWERKINEIVKLALQYIKNDFS